MCDYCLLFLDSIERCICFASVRRFRIFARLAFLRKRTFRAHDSSTANVRFKSTSFHREKFNDAFQIMKFTRSILIALLVLFCTRRPR